MKVDVDEYPCKMHDDDRAPAPCGEVWYQFTHLADTPFAHTIGGCCRVVPTTEENAESSCRYEPLTAPVTGEVDVDDDRGVITLTLVDADGPVSMLRFPVPDEPQP